MMIRHAMNSSLFIPGCLARIENKNRPEYFRIIFSAEESGERFSSAGQFSGVAIQIG